jgi:Stress responsive A/B Barrel Domain
VIQHIVLLKWKPDTTDAQINDAFDRAQELVKQIDNVDRVTLGRNRAVDDHGYTHAIIVKLSDDALESYLANPVRKRYVTEILGPLEEERIELDLPEDLHYDRSSPRRGNWQWEGGRPPSASAAAAALRWEEQHSDD